MFLVPHYFYVSYQESHTEGGYKVKRNAEQGAVSKLTQHTLEAHAKSSNYRIQFSQNPVQLIAYIGGLIQAP